MTMKKIILLNLISLLYLNFSASAMTTDLLIRAQDDETEGGQRLRIRIPKPIQDGPTGDGIEVITDVGSRAIVDNSGNFLKYNVDKKGNISPEITLKQLKSPTSMWPPTRAVVTLVRGRKTEEKELLVKKLTNNTSLSYIEIDNKFTSKDFNSNILKSIGIHGLKLSTEDYKSNPTTLKDVDQMPFFDSVSTFGTVWSVLNMYENDIHGLKEKRGKIRVYPHMTPSLFSELYPGEKYEKYRSNAFYDNTRGHVLCFFPIASDDSKYTSQSFDVVAHETGHYVLHVLRPDLWQSASSDIRAFHESFGDLTALFSVLSFAPLRQKVLEETGENLHKASFLSVIGEKIVDRDAARCTDLSALPSCEEHDLSERLTRALYGTLADFFDITRGRHGRSAGLDLVLKGTVDTFRKSFLSATRTSKLTSFVDFGKSLMGEKELPQYLVLINFSRQQIDLTNPLSLQQICLKEDEDQSTLLRCSTGRLPKPIDLGLRFSHLNLSSSPRSPSGAKSSLWY